MFNNQAHFIVKSAPDYYEVSVAITMTVAIAPSSRVLDAMRRTARRGDSTRNYLIPLFIYQFSHLLKFWTNTMRR